MTTRDPRNDDRADVHSSRVEAQKAHEADMRRREEDTTQVVREILLDRGDYGWWPDEDRYDFVPGEFE